jgi:hypothetical protein
MAMLLLVAGVAGTLYVRHGDEMTDTEDLKLPATDTTTARAAADGEAERPSSVDMPVAPDPTAAAATPVPADEESGKQDGYTADVLGQEAQAELSREVAEQRLERSAKDAAKYSLEKKAVPTTKGGKKVARKPVDPKGPIANAVSGADPLIEGDADLRGGLGGASATRGRADDKMQKAGQPPAAPPSSTASTGGSPKQSAPGAIDFADPGAGDTGYRVYKDKPMSPTELRASEGKLGVAVKKNDCLTAARIANDILDRNRDYYYKKVAPQAKRCQMYVTQETKNRSARRASKNVGAGKNVAAPQKAKAAPQKDEAAAEAAE